MDHYVITVARGYGSGGKQIALKLAERLGISIADTMAIGDAENDLPMLKAAGHSVAMGNAVAAVKKVCDYETGTCQENGWAAAVFRYVLDQK